VFPNSVALPSQTEPGQKTPPLLHLV